ncbi:hypothetical protein ILUMI_27157 [Ignelater luminosus]|uniref:Transcriptional coactivator p15 (PC4) C-terminal domain-containing protein n=1 Tax=Ignelater luminosus TaxID=2038154 RepID=A0A8K0FY02_IGNLU|nr:hypothetical protein ILUMI_27157 [Ignelater luminosus]
MPKNKPSKKDRSESSDSDSGPEDRGPAKKQKTEEENSWDLGKNRFVKLSEFKGKWYVNIREFYDSGGELKPGKKGIMLTMEQWQKFKSVMSDIDEAVKRNV